MLPGSDATDVYVVGQPIRGAVEGDSFVVVGMEGELVELEFTEGDDPLGRMRIETTPGSQLTFDGIWIEDGTAFVTRIGGEGGEVVVNGLRMAAVEAVPQRVVAEGIVLAASDEGDALVVRPVPPELPDLHVVVTPGTAIEGVRDEGDGLDLEFGDSVRVEGTAEAGYVVATRLVLRRGESGEEQSGPDGGNGAHEDADGDRWQGEEKAREDDEEREGPGSLVRPGGGRGRGRGIQPRD